MWEDKRNETNSWVTVVSPAKPEKCEHVRNLIPLYTAPPKREPLSDEEVFDIGFYKAGFDIDHDEGADYGSDAYGFLNGDGYVDNEPYFKFVRAIEKAHGIGGGE